LLEAAKEGSPSGQPAAENQASANVAAKGGAQVTASEQPSFELARLRNLAPRLRDEVAELRRIANEMAKAESSAHSVVIDENVWSINSSSLMAKLPPAFILRPTHFVNERRRAKVGIRRKGVPPTSLRGAGGVSTNGDSPMQVLAANISFAELMATAFDVNFYNLVLPQGAPTSGFDLLMTGPEATRGQLQAAIKSQLGYSAHFDSRPTNVLLLTLRQADAPGLHPSKATTKGSRTQWAGMSLFSSNAPISILVSSLQSYFDPPIIDRSGLTGKFDITFSFNFHPSVRDAAKGSLSELMGEVIKQSLPEQLGLGLDPGIEPIEVLVVEAEKAN
jgi:uncharacterized protein (TIGR03435 family)